NPQQLISDLKAQAQKSTEYQQLIQLFENQIITQASQINQMLTYGHYLYKNEYQEPLSKSRNSQDIQSQDQQNEKNLCKSQIILQQQQKLNQQQETIEKLTQTIENVTQQNENLREKIKVSTEQNEKQIKKILDKDDLISKYQQKLQKNEDALKKNAQSIIQLKEQNEKILKQIEDITIDRNNLLERLLQEKQIFVEKINILNKMNEDLEIQKKQLDSDILYFNTQKQDFQNQLQKQGRSLSSIFPQQTQEEKNSQNNDAQGQFQPFKMLKTLPKHHKYEVYQISQTLNGQLMASCGGDNQIKIYDPLSLNNFTTIQASDTSQIFTSVAFAPLNDLIMVGSSDKSVQIYNYHTGKLKVQLQGHCDRVNSVQFTSEKDKVSTGSSDRLLKIWDISKGSCLKTINCGSNVRYIDYFQSEPHIITGHNDGSIRLYSTNLQNNKPFYNIQGIFEGGITCCRLSNCHNYIACSSADGFQIKIVDLRKLKVFKQFEHQFYFNNHEFNKCCFGSNDKVVLAGGSDGQIFMWDVNSGVNKGVFKNVNHQGVIVALDFHNVTGYLYSGDSRGNIVIWNS
ncbi:hypothetical protein IMG5_153060, partial [Ichthyophthirius multifiliis]